MSITFDLADPAVKAKLANLPEKMLEYALEVLMKQAQLIVGLAQVTCPVDTGSLRDSIRVERGGEGLRWRQIKIRMNGYIINPKTGQRVNYGQFQEFGTRYIAPKLFLTQAFLEVEPTIARMIEAQVVEKVQ